MTNKEIEFIEQCGGFRFFNLIYCQLMIMTKYGPKKL